MPAVGFGRQGLKLVIKRPPQIGRLRRVRLAPTRSDERCIGGRVEGTAMAEGGLLTLVAMRLVLSCRIVGPLQAMANHAIRLGENDNLKARLASKRTDEIGTLSNEFDRMVKSLSDARKKILNSAHRAGMSEIAAELLRSPTCSTHSAASGPTNLLSPSKSALRFSMKGAVLNSTRRSSKHSSMFVMKSFKSALHLRTLINDRGTITTWPHVASS